MIRSILFSLSFYLFSLLCCLGLVWVFVMPRSIAVGVITRVYFGGVAVLERLILGLTYTVEGQEHLPKQGAYILAVKHQSAYETLKMHLIFGDIAIILKRELSYIPLWGWYALKMRMIPVDRGARDRAVQSIIEGGKRVAAEGRPILIYPQGTRVRVDETPKEKPYKIGTARMAEALNLPVIPVALNSGYFWPKHGFLKRGGTVTFKILPALPAGLSAKDILHALEAVTEPESNRLVEKAKAHAQVKKLPWVLRAARALGLVLFLLWSAWWAFSAHMTKTYLAQIQKNLPPLTAPAAPKIGGYPLAITVQWADLSLQDAPRDITIPLITARFWPIPGGHAQFALPQGVQARLTHAGVPLNLSAQQGAIDFTLPRLWEPQNSWAFTITNALLVTGQASVGVEGALTLPLAHTKQPEGQGTATVSGYADLSRMLVDNNILDGTAARMASSVIDTLAMAQGGTGTVAVPVSVKDGAVYVSAFKVFDLPVNGPVLTP